MDNFNQAEERMLIEVTNNFEVKLDDGSLWSVTPEHMPTVCTWTPTATIKIREVDPNSPWPYELSNTEEGVSVRASRII
ncbi:hypothetical protein ES703_22273 [subsurface metagenome]